MYSIMSDVTKLPNFSQRDAFVVGAKRKNKRLAKSDFQKL